MSSSFPPELWSGLAAQIAAAFRLTPEEASRLEANRTARLVAAIPFAAGCAHPERTALSHLATFLLAGSPSCARVFDHEPSDDADPLLRLAPIADFLGGDPAVIDRGMRLLALVMANGYRKDLEKDKTSGEYNPLLSMAWDYEATAGKLRAALEADAKAAAALDDVMSAEEAVRGFWDA